MVIRDATSADAEAIVAIGGIGFARTHEHLLGTPATRAVVDQTYTREAVAHSIARCGFADDAHFLVAEREGRVVGYLHYDCFASEPELHRIYLDQTEIGRGTGSRLMEELHARLGPDGSYIVMTAVANNTARQFYERHGGSSSFDASPMATMSEYGCRLPARLAGRARGRDAPGTASGVGLGPIRQARRTTPSSGLACGSSSTMRSGSTVAPHRKLR